MHLEADIIKGKRFSKAKLLREAKEELEETKKGKILERALENKKKGKKYKHIYGEHGELT